MYQALVSVLRAFASFHYIEDWECGCDLENIREQYEKEKKLREEAENERIARNKGEKKRFDSGEIPESSALFKKLDEYGTNLDIPSIPFMTGRISAAMTVLVLKADLLAVGSPKGEYAFTESGTSGASTHSGSLEIGINRDLGNSMEAGATISVGGTIAVDGAGVITDYTATGSARISVEAGNISVGVGGDIQVGPDGQVSYDTGVSATGSLGTAIGGTEVSVESTIQRGNSLSATVEANLNPFSGKVDEISDNQIDTSRKKTLWDGKFSQ